MIINLLIDMQPEIWIGEVMVSEPITALTDILVSIVCLFGVIREKNSQNCDVNMLGFFCLMAFSTLWGGIIGHAFFHHFDQVWKVPAWYASMLAIGCLERHAISEIKASVQKKWLNRFLWMNILEIVLFAIVIGITLEFKYVEFHSVYGVLGIVAGFSFFNFKTTKSKRSKQLLRMVFWVIIAALIFNIPIRIDEWFMEADFAHCIMAIAVLEVVKNNTK